MYAPLLCGGRALGVLCVDNPHRDSAFSDDDLRLLVAIAHQAAVFIANRQEQDELRDKVAGLERLPTWFAPKLREQLLKVAVWVERSVRRIVLHFPQSFPWRDAWQQLAHTLRTS